MSVDLALPASRPAPMASARAPAFAQAQVFTDMREAQADWAALERVAPHSAYQRRDWLIPWADAIGRDQGLSPAIVVARAADGAPLALLPLGVKRVGPLRQAELLGGKDANFHLGLFRPGARFEIEDLRALLNAAAAATPGGIDLFALVNQPFEWEGAANPFAAMARNRSPSDAYKSALGASGEAYLKSRLSGDTRKKLRKKETKLGEFGPVRHVVARDADAARAILATFQAQKATRMQAKGIDNVLDGDAAAAFLAAAAVAPLERGQTPVIELHALIAGDRMVATFAGAVSGRRFSGMFNSFDQSPEVARCSPGDLLLGKLIASKCDEGIETFDLGVGEARYKATFCEGVDRLFDAYHPVTAAGRALMWARGAERDLKRRIKQDPKLWRLVESARRWRA